MIQRTNGKQTLPQIFFNEVHIGGNDSLQSIIKENPEKWRNLVDLVSTTEVQILCNCLFCHVVLYEWFDMHRMIMTCTGLSL